MIKIVLLSPANWPPVVQQIFLEHCGMYDAEGAEFFSLKYHSTDDVVQDAAIPNNSELLPGPRASAFTFNIPTNHNDQGIFTTDHTDHTEKYRQK